MSLQWRARSRSIGPLAFQEFQPCGACGGARCARRGRPVSTMRPKVHGLKPQGLQKCGRREGERGAGVVPHVVMCSADAKV